MHKEAQIAAMIDSGASTLFINQQLVENLKIQTRKLENPIPLFNIDGTKNKAGQIMEVAPLRLTIGNVTEYWEFVVTKLGPENLILGIEWLRKMNPSIDWTNRTVCMSSEWTPPKAPHKQPEPEEYPLNWKQRHKLWKQGVLEDKNDKLYIQAGYTYSQQIAENAKKGQTVKELCETIPSYYAEYDQVFSKEESNRLPKHQPWDHSIDLEPDASTTI